MSRQEYIQPDCCAADAIRRVVTQKNPLSGADGWPWDFRGLTDAQRYRWRDYRDAEIGRFDATAGQAFVTADTTSWGAWLNQNWSLYRQFCLQYADTLDRPSKKRRARPDPRHEMSPDDKARLVEAYDELEWYWRDEWNEEEQGWWPGHTYQALI